MLLGLACFASFGGCASLEGLTSADGAREGLDAAADAPMTTASNAFEELETSAFARQLRKLGRRVLGRRPNGRPYRPEFSIVGDDHDDAPKSA